MGNELSIARETGSSLCVAKDANKPWQPIDHLTPQSPKYHFDKTGFRNIDLGQSNLQLILFMAVRFHLGN